MFTQELWTAPRVLKGLLKTRKDRQAVIPVKEGNMPGEKATSGVKSAMADPSPRKVLEIVPSALQDHIPPLPLHALNVNSVNPADMLVV